MADTHYILIFIVIYYICRLGMDAILGNDLKLIRKTSYTT